MFKLLTFLTLSLFSLNALSDESFISQINRVLDENIENKGINKTISLFLENQPGNDKVLLAADCYYGNRMLAFAIEKQAELIDKKYYNQTYLLITKELALSDFLLTNCRSKLSKEQISAISQLSQSYTKYITQYNKIANKSVKQTD